MEELSSELKTKVVVATETLAEKMKVDKSPKKIEKIEKIEKNEKMGKFFKTIWIFLALKQCKIYASKIKQNWLRISLK